MRIVVLFLVFACAGCQPKQPKPQLTPLEELKSGNQRFLSGHPVHPHETLQRIRELKKGQHPFAVVMSCSDSRVPPELIFDQGLGDIFSVRTAGNVIGDYELGSIEYAVEHLQCKLIVVLGHQDCGAVKAYLENRGCYEHFDHIRHLVDYIASEEEEQALPKDQQNNLARAVEANMLHGVHLLKTSEPILKHLADNKKLSIVGAIYNIENGQVSFFEN